MGIRLFCNIIKVYLKNERLRAIVNIMRGVLSYRIFFKLHSHHVSEVYHVHRRKK